MPHHILHNLVRRVRSGRLALRRLGARRIVVLGASAVLRPGGVCVGVQFARHVDLIVADLLAHRFAFREHSIV